MNLKYYSKEVLKDINNHMVNIWEKARNPSDHRSYNYISEYRFANRHGIQSQNKVYIDFVKNLYENLSEDEKYELLEFCLKNKSLRSIENFIRFINMYDKSIDIGRLLLCFPATKKYFQILRYMSNNLKIDISQKYLMKLNTKYSKYVLKEGRKIG